ncbi:hypothetical protein ABI59_05190 [Acidobacteria bacterium Mor1]|nr:hypothetical protein ABI59_05190 [Acidobacteria bacterium Mor1]
MPQLSPRLCEAINEQIKNEISSAYLYLAMSTECSARSLNGAAHWLRRQWDEELAHATKLIDYMDERGVKSEFQSIPAPEFKFEGLLALFEQALAHEQKVTLSINGLMEKAIQEQDHAAQIFLQWFVTEQIEEENSTEEVVEMLRLAGDDGSALLIIDQRLGARTAEANAEEAEA